jgi:hypothetical protein
MKRRRTTLIWEPDLALYANGDYGRLGSYAVFYVSWNSGSRDLGDWKLNCMLPGIKNVLGYYKTKEEAKEYAQKVLTHWIERAGL